MLGLAVVAVIFVSYALVSHRSERYVSGPIIFMTLGIVLSEQALGVIKLQLDDLTVQVSPSGAWPAGGVIDPSGTRRPSPPGIVERVEYLGLACCPHLVPPPGERDSAEGNRQQPYQDSVDEYSRSDLVSGTSSRCGVEGGDEDGFGDTGRIEDGTNPPMIGRLRRTEEPSRKRDPALRFSCGLSTMYLRRHPT